MLSHMWSCIIGPRLYQIYTTAGERVLSNPYTPNPLELATQQVLKGVTVLTNISVYISPIVLFYLWRNGYTVQGASFDSLKLAGYLTLLVLISGLLQGVGRTFNPTYKLFLQDIKKANIAHSKASLSYSVLANSYDCDFSALPISYKMATDLSDSPSFFTRYLTPSGLLSVLLGRPLIYPGSMLLLQYAFGQCLEEGRTNLIMKHNAKRAKIETSNSNKIDTVFVDRRDRSSPEGNTLVICCEGNAGFYEVGIINTPMSAGYSILGWNIPGFAYSTGQPYPDELRGAADAVMQFAINSLHFTPDNIIVYGWSIGGYPASWLAEQYPEIRGLILDATFDHVLPLALPRMPPFMSGIVETTVGTHFDLCNAQHVSKYYGPVTIIRRRADEIISIVEGDLTTNRANPLLAALLTSRYPELMKQPSARGALLTYLALDKESSKTKFLSRHNVHQDECVAILKSHASATQQLPAYPSQLGKGNTDQENITMLLFLASKLMVDVDGNHQTLLDRKVFKQPWSLVTDDSYVQVE